MVGSNLKRAYHILQTGSIRKLGRSTTSYILNTVLSQRARVRLRGWRYRLSRHPGVGDPLRIYDIPVDDLNHCLTSTVFSEPISGFKITDGTWDRDAFSIDEFPLYLMLQEHFEEGIPWEQTD